MKKKNFIKGLLVSFMLLCAAHTWAYDFKTDGIYYNILSEDEGTCEVTYNGASNKEAYSGEVVIPETTTYLGKTYSVTSIGDCAFSGCHSLTEITIPNSVISIGMDAFDFCTALTEITIPNSVTDIGNYAFFECSSLTEINIPNGVTSIGELTFYDCSRLTEITIPNSVTSIGYSAFCGCSRLTEITIPNSVTSIGAVAFNSCYRLAEVTLPNSLTSIEGGTFGGCTSLKEITIPNTVTSIGNYAFQDCESLSSVTSLNAVSPICEYYTFYRVPTSTCVLYIPLGTTKDYSEATGWKDFFNIVEIDTSGIEGLTPEGAEIVGYYGIDGKQFYAPQKGINIVRYSDGTTRKILVQ